MRRVIHREAFGRVCPAGFDPVLGTKVPICACRFGGASVRVLIHVHFDAPAYAQESHVSGNKCVVGGLGVQVPFLGYSWL
jgi:hypothetical protein